MPTISAPLPCLRSQLIQEYATDKTPLIAGKNYFTEKDCYESTFERKNLVESGAAGGRKLFTANQSLYDFQDQFGLNLPYKKEKAAVGSSGKENILIKEEESKAAVPNKESSQRVQLYPKVVSQEDFETTCFATSDIWPELKKVLSKTVPLFFKNVHLFAMLLNQIASGTVGEKKTNLISTMIVEEQKLTAQQSSKSRVPPESELMAQHRSQVERLNPKLEQGQLLPQRVRQLLFNMSRHWFTSQVLIGCSGPNLVSRRFLAAFQIFVEEFKFVSGSAKENNQKGQRTNESEVIAFIKPGFMQVVKVLFEGQVRNESGFGTMRSIFRPVYAKLEIGHLHSDLSKIKLVSNQVRDAISSMIQTRRKIRVAEERQEISFDELTPPDRICKDMFRQTQRVMPRPRKDFEQLLMPITSIFKPKEDLPDSTIFVGELFSTNQLLVDIYAARGVEPFSYDEALQDEQEKLRIALTDKVTSLCHEFFFRLFKIEVPYTVRVMLKALDKGIQKTISNEAKYEDLRNKLFADLLAGCWLSNGFLWSETMGATPALCEEALLQGHILQACRLVIETAMACRQLPSVSHTCFNIPELNQYILSKRSTILKFYEDKVLGEEDVPEVEIPEFGVKQKENQEPVLGGTLLRLADVATLFQLVYSKLQQTKKQSREIDLKTKVNRVFKEARDHLPDIDKHKNMYRTSRSDFKEIIDRLEPLIPLEAAYFDEKMLENYEKLANVKQLMKRSWNDVLQDQNHFDVSSYDGKDAKMQLHLLGELSDTEESKPRKKMLQHPLFRVSKEAESEAAYSELMLQDQYLLYFKQQPSLKESLKNSCKEQIVQSKHNLVWNYTCSHYKHEESEDWSQILYRNGPFLEDLEQPPEETQKDKFGVDKVGNWVKEVAERNFFFSSEKEDTKQGNSVTRLYSEATMKKFDDPNGEKKRHNKLRANLFNVLLRILHHFEKLMKSYGQVINRVYDRASLSLGAREDQSMTKAFEQVSSIDVLFSRIKEDLKMAGPPDFALKTEILLLTMYTKKLPNAMKKDLMGLISQQMTQMRSLKELMLVKLCGQNDLLKDQLNDFFSNQIHRQLQFEGIFSQVLAVRFLYVQWPAQANTQKKMQELKNYVNESKQKPDLEMEMEASIAMEEERKGRSEYSRTEEIFVNRQSEMFISTSISQQLSITALQRISLDRISKFKQKEVKEMTLGSLGNRDYVDESDLLRMQDQVKEASSLVQSSCFRKENDNDWLLDRLSELRSLSQFTKFLMKRQTLEHCAKKVVEVVCSPDLDFMNEETRNGADHFYIFETFRVIVVILARDCLQRLPDNKQQNEYFDSVQKGLIRLLLKKVYSLAKNHRSMRQLNQDYAEKMQFSLGIKLSLFCSDEENKDDAFSLSEEEERDIFSHSINTLLQIGLSDDVELKALTIEHAIATAVEAFKEFSFLREIEDSSGGPVSDSEVNRIIRYLIRESYDVGGETISLCSDVAFIALVLQKGYDFKYVWKVAAIVAESLQQV